MEFSAVADTLLASAVFLAILGAGWLVSWPAGRTAGSISHRTGFHDRTIIVAATARWTIRLVAILVAFAAIGIAAIAVLQLILVGAVAMGAIAGGIALGHAGQSRAGELMGSKQSYQRRAKPLPQLGRQFETASYDFQVGLPQPFEPEQAHAVYHGMPQEEHWTQRASSDRRAPKPRFDWGLIERRAVAERREFS